MATGVLDANTEVTPSPQVLQQFPSSLPLGDRQVLAVAREKALDQILTGDEGLIQQASRHGLACVRSSELVVLLKRDQLIPAVKPVLDRMRQAGFGLDDALYHQALQAAGE